MGCCQSHDADDNADGEPHGAATYGDGAAAVAGPGQHASQTALTAGAGPHTGPGGQNSQSGSRSRRGAGHRGGGVAAALADTLRAGGNNGAGYREQQGAELRQHVWTGRQRPSRAYQGDVAASRKVWTRRSLERERQAFFETRVSNRAEVWATLRQVVGLVRDDNNLEEAQAILDAAGIVVPSGDLADGAYDENGNFYPLVEYVVSDPREIRPPESGDELPDSDDSDDERRLEKGKAVDRLPADAVEVRARLSNRGGPEADVRVRVGKAESVKTLIKRIRQEAGLPDSYKVRIAYLGRILKENRTLEEQNYTPGNMVNVLVSEDAAS